MKDEDLVADHSTKLAIDKAKAPRVTFDIVEDGPPAMQLAPTDAIVWIEVHNDEGGTLLVDPVPDLICEPLLGWQMQRMKKTEISTGHIEWYPDMLPIGAHGVINHYSFIEYPNGCLTYGDGRLQTADERAQLLKAKRKFFEAK